MNPGKTSGKKQAPSITREQALRGKPVPAKILRREPLPDGGLRVTVPLHPTRFQRTFLRIPEGATRHFELDALGADVLAMCDGRNTVRHIIKQFVRAHGLDPAEGEAAVVAFLRTMMKRGLVLMVVPGSSTE